MERHFGHQRRWYKTICRREYGKGSGVLAKKLVWAMGGGFATAQDKNEKTSMLLLGNGRRLFDFLLQIIKKDGIEKFA